MVNDGGLLEVVADLRRQLAQRDEQIAKLLPYKQCLEEIVGLLASHPDTRAEFLAGMLEGLSGVKDESNP